MTFTYTVQTTDWLGIAPLLVLTLMTLVVMMVDLILPHAGTRSKHSGPANFAILPIVALVGVVATIAAVLVLFFVDRPAQVFNHMLAADNGTLYAYLLILVAGTLAIFLSPAYLKRLNLVHQGEYYALLMLAMVGMLLLAGATSFLIVFVGLEMFSLALYILCSFVAQRKASQEAGMKYFLLSSFASAFLLYGIAMLYAATGSTTFTTIAQFVSKFAQTNHASTPTLLLIALGLLSVGFAFKVSAVPFQSWTPDVYEGAPAPVTAFMSVGTKVAALMAFVRVFGFMLLPIQKEWMPVIWALAVLTIVGGNVMAVVQGNVKRMLAYSSIAHGGYLLLGVVVGGVLGSTAILLYLSCYLFLNIGAFGVISVLEQADNSGYSSNDLRGLWYRQPVLAGLLAFFLLALAGFPPMAGFTAKYYIFLSALQGGHPELLIIGILASVLGIYYYLRFIATMFMEQKEVTPALPVVPASPVPATPTRGQSAITNGRRASGGLSNPRGGVAVAVRPPSTGIARTPLPAMPSAAPEQTSGSLALFTWIGLLLAALGTLTVGIILPFWLPNLQQAAQMLLK